MLKGRDAGDLGRSSRCVNRQLGSFWNLNSVDWRLRGFSEFLNLYKHARGSTNRRLQGILRRFSCPVNPAAPRIPCKFCGLHLAKIGKIMSIQWNENNISLLGKSFLSNVISNMRNDDSVVKFGETGNGIQPNYQITFPNKRVWTLRGSSHETYESKENFNTEKISQAFSLAEIRSALSKS